VTASSIGKTGGQNQRFGRVYSQTGILNSFSIQELDYVITSLSQEFIRVQQYTGAFLKLKL